MGAGKDIHNVPFDLYWGCGQCDAMERTANLIACGHCRIFSKHDSNIEHGPLRHIPTEDLIRDFALTVAAKLPHRFELSGRDVHSWLEKLSPQAAQEVQTRWRLHAFNIRRTERDANIRNGTVRTLDQGELF